MAEFIMQANQQQIVELKEAGYTELVRCKDCMYFRKHSLFCKKGHANNAKPDWHCGDGVKFDD